MGFCGAEINTSSKGLFVSVVLFLYCIHYMLEIHSHHICLAYPDYLIIHHKFEKPEAWLSGAFRQLAAMSVLPSALCTSLNTNPNELPLSKLKVFSSGFPAAFCGKSAFFSCLYLLCFRCVHFVQRTNIFGDFVLSTFAGDFDFATSSLLLPVS